MAPIQITTGIYGMNFKHMPELDSDYGYVIFWALAGLWMLFVLGWFMRRKHYF